MAHGQSIAADGRRPHPVGHLDHRGQRGDPRQQRQGFGSVGPLPEIEGQPHGRVIKPLDEVNRLAQPGHKIAIGSRRRVHGLQGKRDAAPGCQGSQLLQSLGQEPGGVGSRVAATATAVQHDRFAGERFSEFDCLGRVGDALVERSPVAACKTARPEHAHYLEARAGNCRRRRLDTHV